MGERERHEDRTTIKFLYTNADGVMNKREELEAMVEEEKPDIVAITEAIPKNVGTRPTVGRGRSGRIHDNTE